MKHMAYGEFKGNIYIFSKTLMGMVFFVFILMDSDSVADRVSLGSITCPSTCKYKECKAALQQWFGGNYKMQIYNIKDNPVDPGLPPFMACQTYDCKGSGNLCCEKNCNKLNCQNTPKRHGGICSHY